MDSRVEEKKEKMLQALEHGVTQVHVDARRPGVLVPQRFVTDHHLVLNVSYRFDPPDLSVNDWGVRETLSFQGERFTVGVPWSAIYAIASHISRDFFMYPDDMPQELLQGAVDVKSSMFAVPEEKKGPRAVLREVAMAPLPELDAEEPKPPETEVAASPPKRGHLRIVK